MDEESNDVVFHFSPYQYVVRLGKTYQLAIDATAGDVNDATKYVATGLAEVLRHKGLPEEWIAAHVLGRAVENSSVPRAVSQRNQDARR